MRKLVWAVALAAASVFGVAASANAGPATCPARVGSVRAGGAPQVYRGEITGVYMPICVYTGNVGTDQHLEIFYVQSPYYPGGTFEEVGDSYQLCYGPLDCGNPAFVRVYISNAYCGPTKPMITVTTPAVTEARCV